MIPLRDDAPRFNTPFMTYFLVAFNVVIFLYQWIAQHTAGPAQLQMFVNEFGLIPARIPIALGGGQVPPQLWSQIGLYVTPEGAFLPLLTSMFLHGSWLHLIANMWALWIFGDNIEDHLGRFTYLVFYLASGIAAGTLHTLVSLNSTVPTVGASGAIAGVMGAYFVLYPRARVLTFFFVFFLWLPAWVVLGYWFIVQFLSGAATSLAATTSSSTGGIAFWAHVGGFLAGVLLIKIFPSKPRRYHYGS